MACHEGIEPMHPGARLGCVDCHGGDGSARRRRDAHVPEPEGIERDERVPDLKGDLAWRRFRNPMDLRVVDRTCGECHEEVVENVRSSLHGTTAGHLSDGFYEMGLRDEKGSRYSVFPVSREAGQPGEVDGLVQVPEFQSHHDRTRIETHYPDLVRKECMQCHLYSEGQAVRGRVGFDGSYRGQGCAACHVEYARDGLSRSADRQAVRTEPGHPRSHSMTSAPTTDTCTSCHFGDASIGLHFRGYSQLPPGAPGGPEIDGTTDEQLNRVFYMNDAEITPPDVHHERGMHCIDCHTESDVMGDGALHGQMEYAVETTCQGCHGTFDARSSLVTERGERIRNLYERDGDVFLRSKVTGEEHRVVQVVDVLDPSSSDYNEQAARAMTTSHGNLECYTCHAGWNVNFLGFHFYRNEALTQLDLVSGRRTPGRVQTQDKVFATWKSFFAGLNEQGRVAPYLTGFSTMGSVDDRDGKRIIDQQMPETAAGLSGMTMVHHQLHSTRPTARSCVECHRSPATWGLGSINFRLTRRIAFVADRRGIETIALDRAGLSQSVPLAKFVLPDVIDIALDCDPIQGFARYLYASEGARGIHVLDASDPKALKRIAFASSVSPRALEVAGDRLYCADGFGGLAIFDVSEPGRIELLGRAATFDAHDVSVQWPYAYVADGAGGVAIVDVKDPRAPRVVGGLETNEDRGESQAIDLEVLFQYSRPTVREDGAPADERTHARMLCAVVDAHQGLMLLDVTEASRPKRLWPSKKRESAALRPGQDSEFRGLALASHVDLASPQGGTRTRERDYAYVLRELSLGNGGRRSTLFVFDVSDPENVERVARTAAGYSTEMIVPASLYNQPFLSSVMLAPGEQGVRAIDVTSSEAPATVGSLATMRDAYVVALEEFPLDRMLDESGRSLKDVSHPQSRWLNREEIDRVLGVDGVELGTLSRGTRSGDLPGRRARALLAEHDENGDGWIGPGERAPGVDDADGNGIVTLLEIAIAKSRWPDRSRVTRAGGTFKRSRVDADGDLARLLDGLDPSAFDRGEDWTLDRREMTEAVFTALDLNGDKRLSRAELSRHPGPLRRLRYGVDSGIERSAWRVVVEGGLLPRHDFVMRDEDWQALDADGDGKVSLDKPLDRRVERRGAVTWQNEWPSRQPERTGLSPTATVETVFETFDADRDGELTRRELDARPDLLREFDRNADGHVNRDDVQRRVDVLSRGGLDVCPDAWLERWDLDGDGRVRESEIPALAARFRGE